MRVPGVRRDEFSEERDVGEGTPVRSGADPGALRRFDDEQIGRILRTAAELQARAPGIAADRGHGLTLAELREVASEAGIDPAFIDRAVTQVDVPLDRVESRLAGGPTQWHFHTVIDGEIGPSQHTRILHVIRATMGQKGDVTEVHGRMEWSHDDGAGPVIIGIVSGDGSTAIDVSAVKRTEAGLYHGFGVPLGGFGSGAMGVSLLGLADAVAFMGLGTLGAGASYMALRSFWKARARWWERRLRTLTERITDIVQEEATLPPIEESG